MERCIGAEGVRSIRRERELRCLVCSAGTFIGFVDNIKSKLITKGERMTKGELRLTASRLIELRCVELRFAELRFVWWPLRAEIGGS